MYIMYNVLCMCGIRFYFSVKISQTENTPLFSRAFRESGRFSFSELILRVSSQWWNLEEFFPWKKFQINLNINYIQLSIYNNTLESFRMKRNFPTHFIPMNNNRFNQTMKYRKNELNSGHNQYKKQTERQH